MSALARNASPVGLRGAVLHSSMVPPTDLRRRKSASPEGEAKDMILNQPCLPHSPQANGIVLESVEAPIVATTSSERQVVSIT